MAALRRSTGSFGPRGTRAAAAILEGAAIVSDHTTWYMARFDQDGQLSDEASAELWKWNELVSSTAPSMPLLRQTYGYPKGAKPVVQFLEEAFSRK